METVKQKEKWPWSALFLSFLALFGLVTLFLSAPPQSFLSLFSLKIPFIYIFFSVVFLFMYGLAAFLFRSALQGFLVATFLTTFLIFRFTHLTQPLFLALLFILFFTLEVVIWKK